MRIARRVVLGALIVSVCIIVFVSRENRGAALALAGELVLALLVASLAWVVHEVHELSRGLEAAGLARKSDAQRLLTGTIRRMVGTLVVMLIAGSGLMFWAGRLLPRDPSGEFALMFWILLASGFALSITVAEMITHLIHAFEATRLEQPTADRHNTPPA
ncbi:hypothetical protein [Sinimarinibacterium flocculans]|uniref:hypothetical protein n=1 Tax=Sinimarinibacterium flocculans TaxID=985250 RepID=UPI0024900217|nr:hypothetical protein [Sinimarinibacterium flocculans]